MLKILLRNDIFDKKIISVKQRILKNEIINLKIVYE